MLYIISIVEDQYNKIRYYTVFDTYSHSLMQIDKKLLMDILLNTKIQVVNASIQDNKIAVKSWINGIGTKRYKFDESTATINLIHSGPKFVLLAVENDNYKIVDYEGKLQYIKLDDLRDIIQLDQVANCSFEKIKVGLRLKTEDVYIIAKDIEFEKLIKSKYDSFQAKTAMLSHKDTTFDYEIENHEVRLTRYTGSNDSIILPNFITIIANRAFIFNELKDINLNEGLKVIGNMAFIAASSDNSLGKVEIPSTVELIGATAFYGNDKLFNRDMSVNTDRFKLRNNKTIILDQSGLPN